MKQVFLTLALIEVIAFVCTGCTISYQNIETHGRADAQVEDDAKTKVWIEQ